MSAKRIPLHGLTGCGGKNLSRPIGGAANGMPRNVKMSFSALIGRENVPCSFPVDTVTIGIGFSPVQNEKVWNTSSNQKRQKKLSIQIQRKNIRYI